MAPLRSVIPSHFQCGHRIAEDKIYRPIIIIIIFFSFSFSFNFNFNFSFSFIIIIIIIITRRVAVVLYIMKVVIRQKFRAEWNDKKCIRYPVFSFHREIVWWKFHHGSITWFILPSLLNFYPSLLLSVNNIDQTITPRKLATYTGDHWSLIMVG